MYIQTEQPSNSIQTSFASAQFEEVGSAVGEANSDAFGSTERDALIAEHMPMVRYIARRLHERLPQQVELNEVVSAGLLGLLDAVSKFDQNKRVQFRSYAQFRIRGAILDSLRSVDWSPRELRRKGRQMAEAIRVLSNTLGRTPADAEIAEEMSMPLTAFQQMIGELKGTELGSLDVESTDEAGDAEVNFIAAPASESPLALCIRNQTREHLADALESLQERERLVLTLSYYEGLTLKEIGLVLGVVESRVCQIRNMALARLRKQLGRKAGRSAAA